VVFWVVILCSDVVGYQCFRRSYCFYLQGKVNSAMKGSIDIGREYKRGGSMDLQNVGILPYHYTMS